jgi:hypothetical protein
MRRTMAARVQVDSTTTQATGPPAENPLHALEEDGALRAQAFAKTGGTARAQANGVVPLRAQVCTSLCLHRARGIPLFIVLTPPTPSTSPRPGRRVMRMGKGVLEGDEFA